MEKKIIDDVTWGRLNQEAEDHFIKKEKALEDKGIDLLEWQKKGRYENIVPGKAKLIKSKFDTYEEYQQWEADRMADANQRGIGLVVWPHHEPDEYPCYMLSWHRFIPADPMTKDSKPMDYWDAWFVYLDENGQWDLERLAVEHKYNQRRDDPYGRDEKVTK